MSTTRKFAAVLLLPLFFASLAFAQGGATGAIAGVVQDQSGAVVANAKVSVKSEATDAVLRQVTTDSSGLFTATLLPVGTYTLEVNAAGFPVTRFPGLVVRITETTRMTAVVKTSVVKEVVEVQSQAEQVNTTDATTGESLAARTMVNPLAYESNPHATLSDGSTSDATLYGNTPRNCIIGPPQKNVDLTLDDKTFKLGERQNLRFRTDFFNLFNHPSFANPGTTSVGLAQITSTVGTPRLIQFSLKYSF
jgi:Carboxypeptidase regulatory-like domain